MLLGRNLNGDALHALAAVGKQTSAKAFGPSAGVFAHFILVGWSSNATKGPPQRNVPRVRAISGHRIVLGMRAMIIRLQFQLALTVASMAFGSTASATTYTATFLGTLGELDSYANAINNAGQVVGVSTNTGSSFERAVIWKGTTAVALDPISQYSSAAGINDAGQVVGYSRADYNVPPHATLWNGTTAIDLGTLGGSSSYAAGINNVGQVAGTSDVSGNGERHGAIWNGTTAINLGTLGGWLTYATGINDAGQVVGYSSGYYPGRIHATLWNGTTAIDLGTLGGSTSFALRINNAGQVVGSSYTAEESYFHATLWNGTSAVDLGTSSQYSVANAINSAGQVVGVSNNAAALWNGTIPVNLNTYLDVSLVSAGWILEAAYGINDEGSVVGKAFNKKMGVHRGFLLSVSAVPEPQTYTLMLAGLGLIAGIARRRRQG